MLLYVTFGSLRESRQGSKIIICVCRINSTECNCRPHSHTKTGFPEGPTTMARPQEQVFVCRRAVFEGLLD